MSKNNAKIDLSILKRMVSELENTIALADGIRAKSEENKSNQSADRLDWMVELNKATGLAAGVMTEAGMLMGDIQTLLQGGQATSAKQDTLASLLSPFKGQGSAN